ncbi:hypothetical protein [Winogradskyella sp. 3972H.M.0a.05]|uniref:hypothetical protein n=1 Tax=Winogradskyella sp. 3972H.M.0a.05 TaxID=2950277 RepID=UPI003399B703
MFKQFTYKQKFFGVVIASILLGLAIYKKTYKHIFDIRSELRVENSKVVDANLSHNEMIYLKNELNYLDDIIGGSKTNPETVQQKILNFITGPSHNVNVVTFQNPHVFEDNEFFIHSNTLELTGNYEDLLKLLYKLEKDFKDSRVSQTKFYTKTNYRTRTKTLYLKIIFQNYEKA